MVASDQRELTQQEHDCILDSKPIGNGLFLAGGLFPLSLA